MIRPLDALTLARTKIRSKRIRLLITTIVSALVFGVMAGFTVLIDGIGGSLTSFAKQNLKGQYLVEAAPNPNAMSQAMMAPNDPTMIAEVQALHTAYIAERKAAAKRLGITEYDEKTEIPAVVDDPNPSVPPEWKRTVNMSSVAYARWAKAKAAATPAPANDSAAFRALIAPYGATRVYEPRDLSHLQLHLLPGGKEDLTAPLTPATNSQPDPANMTALAQGSFTIVEDALVGNFVAPVNAARQTPLGVPVLISADDAVTTFGKTLSLPKRPADPKEQIAWFTTVRDKVNGATFLSCYRNQPELARIEQAKSQLNEITANKNNRDYVRPSLEWALPTTPCGLVTVAKDTRTQVEKFAEASRLAFEREFNPVEDPAAEPVTFQIVGLLPSPSPNASGIDAVLASVVGTNYGFGAVVPETLWQALPPELRHDTLFAKTPPADPTGMNFTGTTNFIAAFPTVAKARDVVRANSCSMGWTPECQTQPFQLSTYGTNYLAVDDITTQLRPVLLVMAGLAFGIATIILWAMMGRVIADSRRETAVFRAIGAKRTDIIAVYLTYSLWVAGRIVFFAALIGAVIVGAMEILYAGRATTLSQLAYGVFTPEPRFTFIGLQSRALWLILGGIVVMSLVAITPPLLRNIRRNPIKDMRDD